MKKRITPLIILLFFFNCKKENLKSDFIGNWSTISNSIDDLEIQFFNDSIVYDYYSNKYSTNWKVLENKIEQTLIHNLLSNEKGTKSTLEFSFNKKKDTLFLNNKKDSISLVFKKINNSFEYFTNKIGIDIELPSTNEKIVPISNKDFGINIYIGKQRDTILIKTDEYLKRFGELKYKIGNFYFSNDESKIDSLRLNLFVDKEVSDSELDSIKTILKEYQIKRFFRIYNNKEYIKKDWKAEINWLGKYEN
uniref:hypothetical protein n=1 Tax=uncultured Polaribacter sp. TaxID=174711 RepID=UPI0026217E58|nr:hypothetical protein [uncultured Polaribacter sp.]